MLRDPRPEQQPPAYLALVTIIGGLLVGLIAVLLAMVLMDGPDATRMYLAGARRIPGIIYRVGALVMVLGTGVGMVVLGPSVERVWRRRQEVSKRSGGQ